MNIRSILRISGADIRNILRDYSLVIMLFVPLLILVIVRFGVPQLVEMVPQTDKFIPAGLAMMSSLVAVFPAFMFGFVMMDEKDGGMSDVYRISPLSIDGLLILRSLEMILLGTVNSLLLLKLNGLIEFNFIKSLLLALQMSLFSPLSALLMLSLASNKIEAAAILKIISFIIFLAFLQFFIPGNMKYLLSPIPLFWTFRAFEKAAQINIFLPLSLISVAMHALYITILHKSANKRF